jgi:phage shock protein A
MRLRRRTPSAPTPLSLLDRAYDERLDAMQRLRSAHAAVLAAEARLERDRRTARAAVDRLEEKARLALNAGDETAAKAAAAECVPLDAEVARATHELDGVRETEAALSGALRLVGQQLDTLRRKREAARHAPSGKAALVAVQADLKALASAYAPVSDALSRVGSDRDDGVL